MRNLIAGIAVPALAAGMLLATSGLALADDNHSTRDDHGASTCSAEHSVNVGTCLGHAGLGDLHII